MKKINIKDYTSKYFIDTIKVINNSNNIVTLKFFSFQNDYILSGIKFVKEIINKEISKKDLNSLTIYSRNDGEIIRAKEPILIIQGHYKLFGYLENILDGILSRLSSISTNANMITKLIEKDIIYMADRSDLYINQPYDGYAAYIGGIKKFSTKALCTYLPKDSEYVGTIPHALIQQYDGNLVEALTHYHKTFPKNKLVALIDYNNDCIDEIEKISKTELKEKIYAVRIDTSSSLIDKSLQNNKKKLYGVNHELVSLVRKKLDNLGMKKTKIIVSSGINLDIVKQFEKQKTPIDIYGIGNYFLNREIFFTGDLIKLNNKYQAKHGRDEPIEKYIKKMIKW